MRGGGHDLRMAYGRGMRAACNKAGDMRHIDNQLSAHLIGNLPHAAKLPNTGVGAGSADDGLGLLANGDRLKLVVIDGLSVLANRVERWPVELAAEAQFVTVREMAAVRQV